MSKVFKIGTSSNYGGCITFGNMQETEEEKFFQRLNTELERNNLLHKKSVATKIGTLRKGVSIGGTSFLITNKRSVSYE